MSLGPRQGRIEEKEKTYFLFHPTCSAARSLRVDRAVLDKLPCLFSLPALTAKDSAKLCFISQQKYLRQQAKTSLSKPGQLQLFGFFTQKL